MRDLILRAVAPADLAELARLNDDAVPAVNALGVDGLAAHVPDCALALVAEQDGELQGFVLSLAPGATYASENYRWFTEHSPGSLYVDRIVVAPTAHGRGIGRLLYEAVDERARELGLGHVTCEVNLEPPNPQSLAFHERLGFRRVGTQSTKGGSVVVALLSRDVG
ncbi:GNAT family N-acetyltransferase [uncultured Cellulomonas sp.]|uniref:GNAT family N-acetyltransferase n=1 Tax=uncultured Cellulomonas sp. TaxID=189682 RepID=UPI0028E477CF|nr:GNAT family N-acetyltransferase [uncultured Cellulomonas sp.]